MKKTKPIILISSFFELSPKGGGLMRQSIEFSYVKGVILAGGNPLIVPCGLSVEDISELASVADGLLLPGGGDIAPSHYGEETDATTNDISEERDVLEFALVKCFLEKKKPIFGICRGAQVLNVAMGGNLYKDIEKEIKNPIAHWKKEGIPIGEQYRQDVHTIKIENGTALAGYFKMNEATVNSLHHQAIKTTGDGVIVGARAEDDIVEEVESVDMSRQWLLGVQWHPEALLEQRPENRTLFECFIEATKKSA